MYVLVRSPHSVGTRKETILHHCCASTAPAGSRLPFDPPGTVTYVCGDAPASNDVVSVGGYRGAYIARIEERRVCEYDLTIHVPALCEFEPFLRPHETEEERDTGSGEQ